MKLRNKKTGKIYTSTVITVAPYTITELCGEEE